MAGCCPVHAEKSPSFYVYPDGHSHCFGCGAHFSSAIDFVMSTRNLGFVEAVRWLLGQPELAPIKASGSASRGRDDRAATQEQIAAILRGCGPVTDDTWAWVYLWSRGLARTDLGHDALRAHPALYCHEVKRPLPALVAPIRGADGKVTAVQRIWTTDELVYDGTPKDARAPLQIRKKTLGVMGDGAVQLAPAAACLGLAEGVETAIAAAQLFRMTVWAVCGISRLGFPAHWRERKLVPGQALRRWVPLEQPPSGVSVEWVQERGPSIWVPPGTERLIIFGDRGWMGETVASFAAVWWSRRGLRCRAVFPDEGFGDWNDQLIGRRAA